MKAWVFTELMNIIHASPLKSRQIHLQYSVCVLIFKYLDLKSKNTLTQTYTYIHLEHQLSGLVLDPIVFICQSTGHIRVPAN